jgi:hypothetical protein
MRIAWEYRPHSTQLACVSSVPIKPALALSRLPAQAEEAAQRSTSMAASAHCLALRYNAPAPEYRGMRTA